MTVIDADIVKVAGTETATVIKADSVINPGVKTMTVTGVVIMAVTGVVIMTVTGDTVTGVETGTVRDTVTEIVADTGIGDIVTVTGENTGTVIIGEGVQMTDAMQIGGNSLGKTMNSSV